MSAERTYPCCQHCADDVIHDVPENGHTLSCTLCDEIQWTEDSWAAWFATRTDAEQVHAARRLRDMAFGFDPDEGRAS